MGSPLSLRDDHDSSELRRLARRSRHAGQSRCLLALAVIYDGASRGGRFENLLVFGLFV